METTRTTVNNPGQLEGLLDPLFLNPQSQDGTEESGRQVGRDEVSAVTIVSRVYTMADSMNNQGRQLQGIEDILKHIVVSSMYSPPPQ